MKKILKTLAAGLFLIGLVGCSNAPTSTTPSSSPLTELTIFDKVQQQLDDSVYKTIQCDDNSCKLDSIVLTKEMGRIIDTSYYDKEVYLVEIIDLESKTVPNNIVIYVSKDNEKIIGYGYLD